MPIRDRRAYRGDRRAHRIRAELGDELREARLAAGLAQSRVAPAAGVSVSQLSRIERALVPTLSIAQAARLASVLGRDLSVRTFPVGPPIRDAAHVALLQRLRSRVADAFRWRFEAPIAAGDLRAFDALAERPGLRVAVEAETRLRDLQATLRELSLKKENGSADRLVLLVAATRHNRLVLESARPVLDAALPVRTRAALTALARDRDPGGDALVIL